MVALMGKQRRGSHTRATHAALALIGSLIAGAAAADWGATAPVDNAPTAPFAGTFSGELSVGANGTATALFFQISADTTPASGNGSPFAVRRAAGAATWSTPAAITTPTAGAATNTSTLASKTDGSATGLFSFMASGGSANQTLATAWPSGAAAPTAATPVLCTAPPTPKCATSNLRVAFDGAGKGYAIGTSGSSELLFASTDAGGNWQAAKRVQASVQNPPNLAVDSAGNIVVVYANAGHILGIRMPAGTVAFEAPVQLSGPNQVDPAIQPLVLDAAGTATVTFLESNNPVNSGGASLRAVRWPLGAVPVASQTLSVSTAGSIIAPGALAVDLQGRVTAAWKSARAIGDGTVYAAQLLSGNTFGAAAQVSPANSNHTFEAPQLAVDDAGTLTLIYSDSPGPGMNLALVAQRKAVGAPWSALSTLSSAATGAGAVIGGSFQVASRLSGQTDVIFVQALNGTNRLFATRFAETIPPTILIGSPANAAKFSQGQSVNADYACMDELAGSGVRTCEGNVATGQPIDTQTLGANVFTVNATDNVGNSATQAANYTVEDTIAPTVIVAAPDDGAVYGVGQAVNASYSCADNAGGSGVKTCAGTVVNGQPIDTQSAGAKSFTVTASDNAGNSASKTVSYTVNQDRVNPTVTITAPANGASFRLGQVVNASYVCADDVGGSGVNNCIGTVADGSPIDTQSAGSKRFTVTATDNAGNSAGKTVSYTVTGDTGGGTPTQFALTVAKSGNGTVTGSGINCGTTCSASYAVNTVVTLTATANMGFRFTGWSGDCTGASTCTVTINAAKSVTANFTQTSATLNDISGKPVTISTSNGSIVNAMMLPAAPSGAPAGFTYPNGFFSFDITGLAPGTTTAVVTLTLPAGSAPTAYVKCNAAGTVCAPFAGATFPANNVVTLTLVDGGAGDSEGGVANGMIKDPGAPAVAVAAPIPAGDGGALDSVLLSLMMLGGALRRRKMTAPA